MVRKVIHIIFAGLLLLSSTGFVMHRHFCLDNLVSATLFVEANTCQGGIEDAISTPGPTSTAPGISRKSCCDDVLDVFELSPQEQTASFDGFTIAVGVPPTVIILNPAPEMVEHHAANPYKPPLLYWNLPVRFQQFRC